MGYGLEDEFAVERVAVDEWEGVQKEGGGLVKGQFRELVTTAECWDVGLRSLRERQFSDAVFDGDLGGGDGAEKDRVAGVFDDSAPRRAELFVAGPKPESIASIDENVHSFKVFLV